MIAVKAMVTTLVAIILLLVGLAFSITPIPLGLPLILIAVIMLVASNRYAVHMMIFGRRHIGLFDRWVGWLEVKGGQKFGRVLRKTRPGRMPRR
ncbi:MAG TPA: hypothetical protein VKN63_00845 [Afifellaceae bacterium]|nr:hypothetical protein [Afifellaceae bacterium]